MLAEAGARDTDLLIACAAQDETNLVCCKIAQLLFNVPTRIARVRSSGFDTEQGALLLGKDGFGVDRINLPGRIAHPLHRQAGGISRGAAGAPVRGRPACLVSVRARLGAPMVGMRIAAMREAAPDVAMRIVAIYRRFPEEPDRFVACEGSTRVEPGDEVFVLSAREQIPQVLAALHRRSDQPARPVRRIMVAGGGRVGQRLARQLAQQGRFHLKIIESNPERCQSLAAQLPSDVLVLQGDATDEDLLGDEGIEEVDLFLALTGDDEDNIMASLLAKRMGARGGCWRSSTAAAMPT